MVNAGLGGRLSRARSAIAQGIAADGEEVERSGVGWLDGEIPELDPGEARLCADPLAQDDGSSGEEPLDEGARQASPESERVESDDAADAGQSRLVVDEGLSPGGDPPHLDRSEVS